METIERIFILLGSLDRRIIFLTVGLSVLIPLLKPEWINLPIRPRPESQTVFDELNKLNEGDKILLSFDYGPSTKPEIHPMSIAILKHLYAKNIQVKFATLNQVEEFKCIWVLLYQILHGYYFYIRILF